MGLRAAAVGDGSAGRAVTHVVGGCPGLVALAAVLAGSTRWSCSVARVADTGCGPVASLPCPVTSAEPNQPEGNRGQGARGPAR
jgi:hypothetical protein